MHLTKTEIIRYLFIILVFAAVPYIVDFANLFWVHLSPTSLLKEHSIKDIENLVKWSCVIISRIITTYFIHISEKRAGNYQNIIWQLFGLIFGFTGFLGYAVWNIMVSKQLFMKKVNNSESLIKN
jgi:hypothetical protein